MESGNVITTFAGLERLAGGSLDTAASEAPTEELDWIRACAETFATDGALRVVTVGPSEATEAVAPLVLEGGRLHLLGERQLDEPAGFGHASPEALESLAAEVFQLRRPLVLGRLWAKSPTIEAVRRASARRAAVVIRPAGATPVVTLDTGWADPEGKLNSRRRSDIRRARRRAESAGDVSFEETKAEPSEVGRLLDEAFRVEAAGWKGRSGTALARDELRGAFFRRYCRSAAERGTLRVSFLRIGERAVAVELAVEHSGRLWLLKIGYEEEFARCSPGTLLMLETLRRSAERGVEAVEFLGSAAAWTKLWTLDERPCVSVRTFPYAPRGVRAAAADTARLAARRIAPTLVERAGLANLAGRELEDAVQAAHRLAAEGRAAAICYWNAEDDRPADVAEACLAALGAIEREHLDAYLSVKLNALGFSTELLEKIAERAAASGLGVHLDAMWPEAADAAVEALGDTVGCTLPGRWRRSLDDADMAVERNLRVRVVKGQWADPAAPDVDPRAGVLAVIDRLAGRARRVAVATHDAELAREALARLRVAGTPHELELMYRGPGVAAGGAPVRVYVPFGHPSLPYPLADVKRRPRALRRFAADVVVGGRRS